MTTGSKQDKGLRKQEKELKGIKRGVVLVGGGEEIRQQCRSSGKKGVGKGNREERNYGGEGKKDGKRERNNTSS